MVMIQHLKNLVSPSSSTTYAVEGATGPGGTVLLVDDEPEMRAIGRIALEQIGLKVVEAANGEEALRVCADRAVALSLVVSDVLMPQMDGFSLVRRLQAQRPELPVILLSGHIVEEDLWGDAVAQVRYLPKPYHLQDLQNAVIDMIGPVLSVRD